LIRKGLTVDKSNFSIWLAVNEDGDAAVSLEGASEARETLTDEYGDDGAIRTVKLPVAMALPEVTKASIDVPDNAGQIDVAAA
jgi:hypothetical protein